ncbi:DUF1998 domain-containing protein [Halobacillus kuroshimensis]|uniref:DUF1998 domain-containing protein n=1 Tax=Halobacillus kuroshimensis TaxID=302481 RepID=A0ABS3DYM7_9BACI|nr:DUF1998 domain-containing protein [Halobacillus kuroshimensis]MBN8236419.1 DUF1998 domain-containing protein [Halobacillus kuroshimensis]
MSNYVGEVRPSQYITTFGPGSIVDLPDYSIIMAGINKWPREYVSGARNIEEPRLKKMLNIQQIKSIPVKEKEGTLPAYKFPEYHVCPKCRRLGKYNGRDFVEEDGILYCKNPDQETPCNKIKTHPVRFITACKRGHIQDFPWLYFAHKEKEYDSKKCKLYLKDEGETGSISDLKVYCSTCKQERLLKQAFDSPKTLGKCFGDRPWLRDQEECDEQKQLLLRGASNIYFSSLLSSIVIPSDDYHDIESIIREKVDLNDEELMGDWSNFQFYYKRDTDIKRLGLERVWEIIRKIRRESGGKETVDLKAPEYKAFLREPYNYDGEEFEVEKAQVPDRYEGLIENLIRVKRLKEVTVLKGFTRLQPLPDVTTKLSSNAEEFESETSKEAPITNEQNYSWLPGIESYGEGIFFTINDTKLRHWEQDNELYEASMQNAHNKMHQERGREMSEIPSFPGVRYVLLHTLSHALMREITLHSGYSSSALKERIYSSKEEGMAGILIYTSTVDSEGSLGGLVELGKSINFEFILARALASAGYCSGDPQCAEHGGDKLIDVNGAACHSCLLESETSCENSNRYLDRTVLVKTVLNQQREFFND